MAESITTTVVRAFGRTDIGKVRKANEDAFLVADLTSPEASSANPIGTYTVGNRGVLLAVSDGMGGAQAGAVASALVIESLRQHLGSDCKESQILESVRCAIEQTNLDVWSASHDPSKQGMGATLVAVVVHTELAYVACVGDSRVYLVRFGSIRQVTKDQSYVETLVDAGVMTREQAEKSPYKSIIVQAMGQSDRVNVALGRVAVRRGDVFLLCSDGISGKLSDDEMLRVLTEGPDQQTACKRLIELANERGGEDNSTVIIAEVTGDNLPHPTPDETVSHEFERIPEPEQIEV